MHILNLKIHNYRNLDGISISLNPTINFIVGENNAGKSNFLELLSILFNEMRFKETDFFDVSNPIKIEIKIGLNDSEIGLIQDFFDPQNPNQVNLVAIQKTPDEYIRFYHVETDTEIHPRFIKRLNFIYYDPLRQPSRELKFDKKRGVGKFLCYIIQKYLKEYDLSDIDFIDMEKIEKLLPNINDFLKNIMPFNVFSISAQIERGVELLGKLFVLYDERKIPLDESGYGVQFSSLIPLVILEKILSMKRLDDSIVQTENGNYIPLILALDEPEIHLHPYLQRAMVKYIQRIIENKDKNFVELIKYFFDIDGFMGQSIIVTHSPSILLDNYKYFVRFFKDTQNEIRVKSGEDLSFDEKLEKHLLRHIAYIKEAFFAKCVILVEGNGEVGALPIFAQRSIGDLDELGICVIQAQGADTIPSLAKILDHFGIKSIVIFDKNKKQEYEYLQNAFFTSGEDFEEEIFDSFDVKDYIRFIEENHPERKEGFYGKLKKLSIPFNPKSDSLYEQLTEVQSDKLMELKNVIKEKELEFLRNNKTIPMGIELATYVTNIPQVYGNALIKAKELVSGATKEN